MPDATSYPTLLEQRDAAGARYLASVLELRAAWIDLHGIDQALANGHVSTAPDPVRSFGTNADMIKLALSHPVYVPDIYGSWASASAARRDQIVHSFSR